MLSRVLIRLGEYVKYVYRKHVSIKFSNAETFKTDPEEPVNNPTYRTWRELFRNGAPELRVVTLHRGGYKVSIHWFTM